MTIPITKLEGDDTWLCHHADSAGNSMPATRLQLSDTHDWPHPVSNGRRWVNCPECDTRWRVWVVDRVAKASTSAIGPELPSKPLKYRHAPLCDIDRVIDLVCQQLPDVKVVQYENSWPADDDGIWFFGVPNVDAEISLETEIDTGMCPFFVYHDGMPSPADGGGWTATTVESTAKMVIDYFSTCKVQ